MTTDDLLEFKKRMDAKLDDINRDLRVLNGMSIAGVALGISILVILMKLYLK